MSTNAIAIDHTVLSDRALMNAGGREYIVVVLYVVCVFGGNIERSGTN